jgi:hypothetical protein
MSAEVPGILQVGVIGVGPLWRRWLKPALLAERDRYGIVLVADQNRRRADDEAAELRCPSLPSAGRLIRHPEVDVVLLADPQWHGLWALEEALKLGKPVLSAVPLGAEPGAFTRLEALLLQAERAIYFVEPMPALELLERWRSLTAELGRLRRAAATSAPPGWPGLARLTGLALRGLEGQVSAVQAVGAVEGEDFPFALFLEGQLGWKLSIESGARFPWPRLRLQMEHGLAELRFPNQVVWSLGDSKHRQRLPRVNPMPAHLHRFFDLVWAGAWDEENQQEAIRNGRLMQAALRSFEADGKRVVV